MSNKILVIHPAQQHSFYTAKSLDEKNMLYGLVTSLYYKPGTIMYVLAHILPTNKRTRLENRRNNLLDDKKVIVLCECSAILELLSQRLERVLKIKGLNYKIKYWHQKRFDRAVEKYIRKNSIERIITYDNYSCQLYKMLHEANLKVEKILDMSAPAQEEFLTILEKHRALLSKREKEKLEGQEFLKRVHDNTAEINMADIYLCASHITSNSVKKIKQDANCIISRYGVDSQIPSIKQPNSFMVDGKMKIVMIGAIGLFKGFPYLIKSINEANLNIELHCYGLIDDEYMKANVFLNPMCKLIVHGHVPQKILMQEITNYDVLVFGSLCDGFGFGALEAILSGVPAIISNRAGLSEVIAKKDPSLIYDPYDYRQLAYLLNKCYNSEVLRKIQKEEMICVSELKWENYAESLNELNGML